MNIETHLAIYKELVPCFEEAQLVIAGSLALTLQGYNLGRGVKDLDLLAIGMNHNSVRYRVSVLITKDWAELADPASSTDFARMKYKGIDIDIRGITSYAYTAWGNRANYMGENYPVELIDNIMRYKMLYAMRGTKKHHDDIINMITLGKDTTTKLIERIEI